MIHKPIQIKDLGISLPHKICFADFNAQISYGNRIAIIGPNGSGKTTLLKILTGAIELASGAIQHGNDVTFGFVPQIIEDFDSLSGGQRLNASLTQALSRNPNVLLLDEPTNHLDMNNRKSLMKMLQNYIGTLIIVSHDEQLLRKCTNILWHIDDGQVHVFSGNYDDYIREMQHKRASITKELSRLERQKHDMHEKLMKEQQRAAKSKASGEKKVANRKWLKMVGDLKGMKAEKSQGKKMNAIDNKKQQLSEQLASLRLPEIIVPKFSITSADITERIIIQVNDGSVGYAQEKPILEKITLSVGSKNRVAVLGDNGSGKSTLIKAMLGKGGILKSGEWYVPQSNEIGYLDQHYNTLDTAKTPYETIAELVPAWSNAEVRRHLSDFLFRKNEEVNLKISQLSGGEKARLSLACIAAKTPKVLILDEITNNLDLQTCAHVVEVLQGYPGALIVISHDNAFLKKIGVSSVYVIRDKGVFYVTDYCCCTVLNH